MIALKDEKVLDLGYQLPTEQFQPDVALQHIVLAEQAGFDSIWVSDHFLPWFHTDAAGSFAWALIASAAQATKRVKLGTGVTCPILRYHPAIVAQAFATLEYMHSNRIFVSLGTGEALNEVPLGYKWPAYKERVERLVESIEIMRKLWTGEVINHQGKYWRLNRARLYTPRRHRIPIYVAASGPTVAKVAGQVADGFLTVPASEEKYRNVIFPALEEGLKDSNRSMDQISKSIVISMTYDANDPVKALQAARPWAGSIMPERIRMVRPQRPASSGSCVTSTSVAPRRAGESNKRSMIARPVVSSRFPVGSSAINSDGRGESARASATRCCSPPESCAG